MLPYTLRELDKLLPKGKPPSRRLTGIGRNVDLFRSMVSEVFRPRWAATLKAQGWSEVWLDHVRTQNVATFNAPDVHAGLRVSEHRQVRRAGSTGLATTTLRGSTRFRRPGTANAGTTTMATTSTSKPFTCTSCEPGASSK